MATAAAETSLLAWLTLLGWSVESGEADGGEGYYGTARHYGDEGELVARVRARSIDELSVELFCAALSRLEEARWGAPLLAA